MRILVTGVTGFAGSHLVEALLTAGHEAFGLVHRGSGHIPPPSHPNYHSIPGDLMAFPDLREALQAAQPDVIYHLAGQASPALSWENPSVTVAVNVGGTANLLEAALAVGRPRVVVVTSALIYGTVAPTELPITEHSTPHPAHPYGISKWAAGMLAHLYWRRYQLPVIEARPFNHIGPRQALGFVVPDFASQLAAIRLGRQPATISVGNLAAQRDFTDVRDVTRAYRYLADRGNEGESYLICSGRAVSIRHILDTLIELADLDVNVVRDQELARPLETPSLVGSYAKIKRDTGWSPRIDLRQSLADTLDDWLSRLAA